MKIVTEIEIELERGMVFQNNTTGVYYILAQCMPVEYSLISLTNGNRWSDPKPIDVIEEIIVKEHFIYKGFLRVISTNIEEVE